MSEERKGPEAEATRPLQVDAPPLSEADSRRMYKVMEASLRELWDVVDELSRVMPPRPRYYRVTIFGSSRMSPGDHVYGEVRRLAQELAAMGCDIVTGGGPGLMQAANEGERLGDVLGRTRSYGLNVELPHEQAPNPFVEKLYHHGTFFSRLHHFVRLSSAFVVMRGGVGTTLEAMLVWQLRQVGHLYDRPLILVGDMWKHLVEWGRREWMDGDRRLADPRDLELPVCVDSVDAAVDVIREDLERWMGSSEPA
ncbi:MAG: LOG family protein [Gemmatimonadota bacterium]